MCALHSLEARARRASAVLEGAADDVRGMADLGGDLVDRRTPREARLQAVRGHDDVTHDCDVAGREGLAYTQAFGFQSHDDVLNLLVAHGTRADDFGDVVQVDAIGRWDVADVRGAARRAVTFE